MINGTFYGPKWANELSVEQIAALRSGNSIWIGGKCWKVCPGCMQMVCMNKALIGSIHLCARNPQL